MAGILSVSLTAGAVTPAFASAAPDGKTDAASLAGGMGISRNWESWKAEWEAVKNDWTQVSLTPGSDVSELNLAGSSKKDNSDPAEKKEEQAAQEFSAQSGDAFSDSSESVFAGTEADTSAAGETVEAAQAEETESNAATEVNIAEKTAIAEEDIASEESIAAFNAEEGENVAAFSTSENDAEEFAAEANSDENLPDFDTESINSVKVSLMGPLAGIGDSFIWGTLRIIATGVGLSLANQGNILGPILFLLIFNIPAQGLRYYLMNAGYKLGSGFLAKIQENGLMSKLTYAASVLGLMVVGGMTAENVSIKFPLAFGSGDEATTLNDVFNNIMPGLMPLLFTLLVYYLLKKKNIKTTTLLLLCVAIGLIGSFFGILGC